MSKANAAEKVGYITVQSHRLEILRIPGQASHPELIFLHEGLGSVSHWKDFPAQVAAATGCPATVYSRYGSGQSDILGAPHSTRYMHEEGLRTLPDLLHQLRIVDPILIGHSDGGSVAIIYAGSHHPLRGLILLAPHVFVEDLSIESITKAKGAFETTSLPLLLARHHRDATRTFWGWNDIWLDPEFRSWNIEEYLPRITCPTMVIQGIDDQYGTMAQVEAIKKQSGGPVEVLELPNCAHSPQRDQPEKVLQRISKFVSRVGRNNTRKRGV